jgi:hypothetical protein
MKKYTDLTPKELKFTEKPQANSIASEVLNNPIKAALSLRQTGAVSSASVESNSQPMSVNKYNHCWFGDSEQAKALQTQILDFSKKVGKGYAVLFKDILKNKNLTHIDKLIFHLITKFPNKNTKGRSTKKYYYQISRQELCKRSGIKSVDTIAKSIKSLETYNLIDVKKHYDSPSQYFFNHHKSNGNYHFITGLFLEASDDVFTVEEKIFICSIIPHVLGNGHCEYTYTQLEKFTGLSQKTIERRKRALKGKGYITNLPKGFKIDLLSIMVAPYSVNIFGNAKPDVIPAPLPKKEIYINPHHLSTPDFDDEEEDPSPCY